MTEDEKNKLMKNCYDGLGLLEEVLDSLLIDDKLNSDGKILNMKKEVKENMFKLNSMLGESKKNDNQDNIDKF